LDPGVDGTQRSWRLYIFTGTWNKRFHKSLSTAPQDGKETAFGRRVIDEMRISIDKYFRGYLDIYIRIKA